MKEDEAGNEGRESRRCRGKGIFVSKLWMFIKGTLDCVRRWAVNL